MIDTKYNKSINTLFICGVLLRILFFIINLFVGGYNCDEVMLSVNAASIANNLTDIAGEKLPLYFDTWIDGGQSPFATYTVALFVKLFGLSVFSVRLPSLIISIISLYFAFRFAEFFKNERYAFVFRILCICSPWLIFTAVYTMDCNYLGHLLIIGIYFLLKAVENNKARYYLVSMLFFSLCFYSYIASVLLVPFFLLTLYLVLIMKRRISIYNVIISILGIVLFSLPFILWGMVVVGVVPEFELFGFSFHSMPGYVRDNQTIFVNNSLYDILATMVANIVKVIILMLIPDINSTYAICTNIFQYGSLLSGVFVLFGFIKFAFSIRKKSDVNFFIKLISLSSLVAMLFYCALINNARNGTLYRYGMLSYMLIILETIGMSEILKLFKKFDYKKVVSVYCALSVILFSSLFITCYVPQTDSSSKSSEDLSLYGDYFYDCLDFAKENGYKEIALYKNAANLMPSVYLRFYYNDDKEFFTTYEEIDGIKYNNCYSVTKDNSIVYFTPDNSEEVNHHDFTITTYEEYSSLKLDNEHKMKRFGYYCCIFK